MAMHQSTHCLKVLSSNLNAVTQLLLEKTTQIPPDLYNRISSALAAVVVSASAQPSRVSAPSGIKASLAAKLIMQELDNTVTSYATFVPAALAWMHNTTPDHDSHSTSPATQGLFAALFSPMLLFIALPTSWQAGRCMQQNLQLHGSLNNLACYFLSCKLGEWRTHPSIGVAQASHHVMTPALLLVRTTALCLKPLSNNIDRIGLAALPSGFINNIFCLACEELSMYLSHKNHKHMLARSGHLTEIASILGLVVNCVDEARGTTDHQQLCNLLLGQGALEAAKWVKLAYCSEHFKNEHGTSRAASDLNDVMSWCGGLFPSSRYGQAEGQLRAQNSSSGSSLDASFCAPRSKVTDAQLIAAVRDQSCHTPSSLCENSELLTFLWFSSGAKRSKSDDPYNETGNAEVSLGISHHCTLQVLLWMRQVKCTHINEQRRQQGQANPHTLVQHTKETKLGISQLRRLMDCSSIGWLMKEDLGALINMTLRL